MRLKFVAALAACVLLLSCKAEDPTGGLFPFPTGPGGSSSGRVTVSMSSTRNLLRADGGQTATITARVTKVENGVVVPVRGVQVQFGVTPQNLSGTVGTVSTLVGTTDGNGNARTVFRVANLTFVPTEAGVVIKATVLQEFRSDNQSFAPSSSIFIPFVPEGVAPPGTGTGPTGPLTEPAPNISNILPDSGPILGGTTVLLFGLDFKTGAIVFFVNSQRKEAIPNAIVTATLIEIKTIQVTATEVGIMNVFVQNPDGQVSNVVQFTYTATATNGPFITSLIPNFGRTKGGETITINGGNFETNPSVTFVNPGVDSKPGGNVRYINAGQLTTVTPNVGTTGADQAWVVYVENRGSGLTSNSIGFTFKETPQVQPPEIDAVIPAGLGFKSCGGWPGDGDFTARVLPAKCSSWPCPGFTAADQDILIRGRNFKPNCELLWVASNTVYRLVQKNQSATNPTCVSEAGDIVLCGGLVWFSESELRLTMIVPSGVGPGGSEITAVLVINDPGVLTDEAISNSANYSFTNSQKPEDCVPPPTPPDVITVSPDRGPLNTECQVTITGTGFDQDAEVFFGATPAVNVLWVNAQLLKATTPAVASAQTVDLLVRNAGSGLTDIVLGGFQFDVTCVACNNCP